MIVFDEAQRAWNLSQNFRKFKRNASEPEMMLTFLERLDWCVLVCLVGGGQEINDGEAGLEEWGSALDARADRWRVYASPEAVQGGSSVAGSCLFKETALRPWLRIDAKLHLKVSVRSLRAESLASWVNALLTGNVDGGAHIAPNLDRYPLLLSRSLEQTRSLIRDGALGSSRSGLIGSSGAARLRADGLEPASAFHANYPWEDWFLADNGDLRSSQQLEVFATEFEIQGLELDWAGVCWGGDLIWDDEAQDWIERRLRQSNTSWDRIRSQTKRTFRRNAYRVLLTRARQGMVIYVPRGDARDRSRSPAEFDRVAALLQMCGVNPAN